MILTERALRRKLAAWKRDLDIGWEIDVRIERADVMGGDHGRVQITENKRMALILILDPRDANPEEMRPYDMELALVHELCHVMLAPFAGLRKGDHRDVVSEQCIHATSKALVRMKRAAQKGKKKRCSTPTRRSLHKPT